VAKRNFKKEYKALSSERDRISNAIVALRQEWVKEAPVKAGDIVVITGYAYTGKKMRVDSVFIRDGWRGIEFVACGAILKKDGTPGAQRGETSFGLDGKPSKRIARR
jgi:hypothetical protein